MTVGEALGIALTVNERMENLTEKEERAAQKIADHFIKNCDISSAEMKQKILDAARSAVKNGPVEVRAIDHET